MAKPKPPRRGPRRRARRITDAGPRCPRCGCLDLRSSPRSAEVYQWVRQRKRATSRELMTGTTITIQTMSNILNKLCLWNALHIVQTLAHSSGGIEHVYAINPLTDVEF